MRVVTFHPEILRETTGNGIEPAGISSFMKPRQPMLTKRHLNCAPVLYFQSRG